MKRYESVYEEEKGVRGGNRTGRKPEDGTGPICSGKDNKKDEENEDEENENEDEEKE